MTFFQLIPGREDIPSKTGYVHGFNKDAPKTVNKWVEQKRSLLRPKTLFHTHSTWNVSVFPVLSGSLHTHARLFHGASTTKFVSLRSRLAISLFYPMGHLVRRWGTWTFPLMVSSVFIGFVLFYWFFFVVYFSRRLFRPTLTLFRFIYLLVTAAIKVLT